MKKKKENTKVETNLKFIFDLIIEHPKGATYEEILEQAREQLHECVNENIEENNLVTELTIVKP